MNEQDGFRWSPQRIKTAMDAGENPAFVDVRRHPDDLQVADATRYDPEALLSANRVMLPYDRDRLIITYCT